MVESCSCSALAPVARVFLLSVLLSFQVTSVVAVVERYVAPTSNFTTDVNATLAGASADHYVVHLSAGLYTGCGPTTIELNSGSALSVTVIGAGEEETMIDCEDVVLTNPVFTCGTGCTAVLQNVTVARVRMTTASPDNVGALVHALSGALVTLENVIVTSCWTVTHGGFLHNGLTGASSVVRVAGSGTRLLVVESIFSSNTGEIGSISAVDNSQVSLDGSHFEFNTGGGGAPFQGRGGVLSLAFGAIGDVSQSSFVSNSANKFGGIIFSYQGGDVSFVNVTAQDCSAGSDGGVVFIYESGDVSFVNGTAQDCSAGVSGGVVYSYYSGDVIFVDVTAKDCSADYTGGAVYSQDSGDVSFVNVNAQDCSAYYLGGGVVYSLYMSRMDFVNVTARDCSAGSDGGVVFSYYSGHVSFVNVTAQDCSADIGGVVFSYYSGHVSFVYVTAQDCSADYGGVVYSYDSGDVSFVDVTAQDCSAGNHGGVVYSQGGGDVSFVDVTAQDCSAGYGGGVVDSDGGGDVSFVDVTAQDCSAGYGGGVVYSYDSGDVSFVDVTAQDCSAASNGGVVSSYSSGDVSFVDVTAQDCSAGSPGGVVYSEGGGDVSFVDVTAQDCSAGSYGGVVYSEGGEVRFVSVIAQDCGAGSGGVVWSHDCRLSFEHVSSQNSFGSGDGYAFFLESSQLVVRGVFESNAVHIIYAGRENDLDPPSTVVLEHASLSCIISYSCIDLEGFSTLSASDSFIFVASGVGVFAVGASVDMNNCSLGGGEGALIISLSGSACVMNDAILTGSAGGLVLYSFSSTLNLTRSIVDASGSGLALASISGSASLELSQLVCVSNSPIISVATAWEIVSTVLVGALPLSFGESATVTNSFLGTTSIGAPALACNPTTHAASSVTCGGGGSLTSPSGTCSSDTAILGAGQPNCHDACFNGSFCVSEEVDREGYWFDSLGCPRCGGPCWLGAHNCNATLAYCYDSQGGGFTCECRTGYFGDGVQCEDVDECLLADACTAPRTVCLNTPGSYSCLCEPGTSLLAGLCRELDECQAQVHDCDASAVCINTPGSFACECLADSYGNGTVPCMPCPSLSVTQGQGSIALEDCLCPPEYYMSSATCEACPGNSTAAAGSTDVTSCFCEPYYYRDSGESFESPCEVCPAGRFALNERQCLPCPSGSFSFENNASSCAGCSPGSSTSLQVGAVTCTCLPYYNSSGSGEDLVCTQSCRPGWRTLGNSCQICGVGFYSEQVNSPKCSPCPSGATTASSTATSPAECQCLPGRVDSGGGLAVCPLNCTEGSMYLSSLDVCVPCFKDTHWSANSTVDGKPGCATCPANSYTIGVGATSLSSCLCLDGFGFDDIRGWCAIQCAPGFAVQTSSCELCGLGMYSTEANSLTCTACPANAVTPAPGATSPLACSCVAGFYADDGGDDLLNCRPCPTGALCEGGPYPPVAVAGYYETEEGAFVECTPRSSCSGDNLCEKGYRGALCSSCAGGFFRMDGFCRPCSAARSAFGALAFIFFLAAASLLVFNLGNEEKQSDSSKAAFGGFLIAFNSFQVIAMFGQLELAWPSFVRDLLALFSVFFNFNVEVVGFECFVGGSASGAHPFLVSWVMAALVPLFVAGGLATGYYVILFLHKCTPYVPHVRGYGGAALSRLLWSSVQVSYLQALLVLYFPLTVGVLEAFQCFDNGAGVRVLVSSPDLACSGRLYAPLVGLAVVATLFYIVGIPALILGFVFHTKMHNSEANFYSKAEAVVGKYRGNAFWYEGVVLLRKACVAAVLLLLTPSPYVRAAGGAFVLLVSFVLNRIVRPYRLSWHNLVECASLLGTIVFMEVGVALQGSDWSAAAKGVVVALTLLSCLGILAAVAGYELWWATRVWRGVSTADFALRVYADGEDSREFDSFRPMGTPLGGDDASVSGGPGEQAAHRPSPFDVPFVPLPPPLSEAQASVSTAVPPPPPLGSLAIGNESGVFWGVDRGVTLALPALDLLTLSPAGSPFESVVAYQLSMPVPVVAEPPPLPDASARAVGLGRDDRGFSTAVASPAPYVPQPPGLFEETVSTAGSTTSVNQAAPFMFSLEVTDAD